MLRGKELFNVLSQTIISPMIPYSDIDSVQFHTFV